MYNSNTVHQITPIRILQLMLLALLLSIATPLVQAKEQQNGAHTVSALAAQTSDVLMTINPTTSHVQVGDTFVVTVEVQAGSQDVEGVAAYLDFDPTILQVQSMTPITTLPLELQNTFNNISGQIDYAVATFSAPYLTGSFDLLEIEFQAIADNSSSTLAFQSVNPRQTDVTAPGGVGSILTGSTDGNVVVGGTASQNELLISSPNVDLYPGDLLSINLTAQGSDIYGIQATCTVDPSILAVQDASFGDFLDPQSRLVGMNTIDTAAGSWDGAISLRNPAPAASGSGSFATLTYQALAPGTTTINCSPLFSDRNGFILDSSSTPVEITVLNTGAIDGLVTYQGRLDHSNIEITATGPMTATALTDSSGNFSLVQLIGGNYDIEADAPRYLPTCTTSNVNPSQTTILAATTLRGGDANDDDIINIGDATLVAANFGASPSDERADINDDGQVNIQDLSILGGNYELEGCQAW